MMILLSSINIHFKQRGRWCCVLFTSVTPEINGHRVNSLINYKTSFQNKLI